MRMMIRLLTLLLLLAWPLGAHAITLANNGLSSAVIVVADQATPPELTAAQELAKYLEQMTGGKFIVQPEGTRSLDTAHIYVGPTRAAYKEGIDCAKLGPEQWIVRTVGEDLIITGGRPRGTLYATYHFLEDALGVHWWNPWEESVPKRPLLSVGPLNLTGQPTFRYRDIYMIYGGDGGRFSSRNRLNREGDAPIDAKYGGSLGYGPPYHVHTFNMYFPPKEFFSQHPEWYSLINGKRTADHAQLCLTNPELRQAFLAKLIGYIESSRAAALAANRPPPSVFSVSQNDWLNPCQCDVCQAIAKAEASEAGPLLDFVNFLADSIRSKYPDVMIDTLAYQYTQKPPKTIRPRDNVIIRLCDTESDQTRSINDPVNQGFHDWLSDWARIAKNLRIWDYAVTYSPPVGLPLPTEWTYQPDYQFYSTHNVEGVFTEHEFDILADMRDFKIWMMIKLLENPNVDAKKLENTFLNGFYGPAGPFIRQYLTALEEEAKAKQTRTGWFGSVAKLTYLDLNLISQGQKLFDQAEAAVGRDVVLLRRVRHARLPLDRATVIVYSKLCKEFQAQGGDPEKLPWDRQQVATRALETWQAQADLRMKPDKAAAEKEKAALELRHYTSLPSSLGLPEKFRDLPRGTVFDYPASVSRNWASVVRVVPDKEAESGFTNYLDLTASNVTNPERYVLPMPWGLYDTDTKKTTAASPIKAEDISGPGYHWYKMGTYAINQMQYLYFFWSWIIQVDIGDVYDARRPDQKFDIWARVKFEGPRFPYAKAGDKDAIYVERLVLVKVQ